MKFKSINYQQKKYWKGIIFLFAILISVGTLLYTRILVNNLKEDQYKQITVLADAYKNLNEMMMTNQFGDISFLFEIIKSNENIPLILTDTNDNILEHRNLDSTKVLKPEYLKNQLEIMRSQHESISINYSSNDRHLVYYKDSQLIYQLTVYPFIQLILVILFILVSYFAFNSSRKYEQNKIWSGMSRETAHQLGTPVSSLIALKENLKISDGKISNELLFELEKDTDRLEVITDRFSKIGSIPKFEEKVLHKSVLENVNYLKPRISSKVSIDFVNGSDEELKVNIIPSLFDWVIENLLKNAINAMEGEGHIQINISNSDKFAFIDIEDDGKGIPRYKQKTIFKAGYTTNSRGWGLGLSLSKRIIELYHKGQIFVKWSEIDKGSIFRVKLMKKR
ncbi:MAG: HAMP domain-containing histidine kinase [Bacteroidetes bacterium]|nr:HAMP domain-containing histidine kinase [Bacteroidota bacterium]MBT5529990.1 HAMP domain-containing histidine kinase [Cytophagia bacterium]MBT3422505.1 HAMP domain-containing histidine kinase [Bacteroidota bacterium]MBT3801067.1 HAMP domain-containing histidine kinase [Bacteroidota bacterium]MBT3933137.1 HAMP domain-containing histidine kinase [Bacteroidota bacterium]